MSAKHPNDVRPDVGRLNEVFRLLDEVEQLVHDMHLCAGITSYEGCKNRIAQIKNLIGGREFADCDE